MNSNQMKNIIVLKNLPSNIIDEAFIVLKSNKKVKSLKKMENIQENNVQTEKSKDYILREAEMVITNYLSKMEKEKAYKSYSVRQIENRYKKMKIATIVLGMIVCVNLITGIMS